MKSRTATGNVLLIEAELRRKEILDSYTKVLKAIVAGMDENPGHSDLDSEQPINVSMTLGDYRRAKCLLYELEAKP